MKGYVINCLDGSVKAVFEGKKENIEDTIRKCTEEQPYGRVDDIKIEWSSSSDEFKGFWIGPTQGC